MGRSSFAHHAHHLTRTAAQPLAPSANDTFRVGSRRWFLQTGVAGAAGVSLADSLRHSAQAVSLSDANASTAAIDREPCRP